MKKTCVAMALLSAFVVLVIGCRKEEPEPTGRKVLFIGNSYTGYHFLPEMVGFLAEEGGQSVYIDKHVVGGCSLERHVKETGAIDKIRSMKWDVVVLQSSSVRPIVDRPNVLEYASILSEEARKQGAETFLYATWAIRTIPEMQEGADPAESPDYARAMFQASGKGKTTDYETWCEAHDEALKMGINGAMADMAEQLGARIVPVGPAWKNALAIDPTFDIYSFDDSHPTQTGSYLAACVFYATLFDKSPVGLAAEITHDSRLYVSNTPELAKTFQEVAWETVQSSKNASAEEQDDEQQDDAQQDGEQQDGEQQDDATSSTMSE